MAGRVGYILKGAKMNSTDLSIDVAAGEVQRLNADIDAQTRDLVASYWTLGQYLHAVKTELPHGTFVAWYTSAGVERNRASRAMQLFTRYSQISQIENFETLTEALYGKRSLLKTGEADPAQDVEPTPEGGLSLAVVDNAAPAPVDDQGDADVVDDTEACPDTDRLLAEAPRLSKDERQLLETDDLKKQLVQVLEDNAQLQEENATLQKQVEAIRDADRPQLENGVAQIAAVKQELASLKQLQHRTAQDLKEARKDAAYWKRRAAKVEKQLTPRDTTGNDLVGLREQVDSMPG